MTYTGKVAIISDLEIYCTDFLTSKPASESCSIPMQCSGWYSYLNFADFSLTNFSFHFNENMIIKKNNCEMQIKSTWQNKMFQVVVLNGSLIEANRIWWHTWNGLVWCGLSWNEQGTVFANKSNMWVYEDVTVPRWLCAMVGVVMKD